jgi:phage terminase large subunit
LTQVSLPEKLIPVFLGKADVRGAYGGRGSAKTRSFATMTAVNGMRYGMAGISGQILCSRQFMNSLDDSSLEEIKRSINDYPFLSDYYEIGDRYIKSRDGRINYTFAGLDRNISSIKSKGKILINWTDEAEAVNEAAWDIILPTLREENEGFNAEQWVTWNPCRKGSATDKRFRNNPDPLYKVIELNWKDNAKFPDVLNRQRLRDLEQRPEQYRHIWEGDYITIQTGAYYAKQLNQAKAESRLTRIPVDPLFNVFIFCDIGGTGAKSDAFSMWAVQFVGKEVRLLNYYEAKGQQFSDHVYWLKQNGYTLDKSTIVLPHDGRQQDRVYDYSYQSEFQKTGYTVEIVDNQGAGAAMARIEATRLLFPSMWFDSVHCEAGIEAIGWYHPKIDDKRQLELIAEAEAAAKGRRPS